MTITAIWVFFNVNSNLLMENIPESPKHIFVRLMLHSGPVCRPPGADSLL